MSSVGRRIKRTMDGQHKPPAWWPKPKLQPLTPISANPEAYLFPLERWTERQIEGASRRAEEERRLAEHLRVMEIRDRSLLCDGLILLKKDDVALIGEDDKARADLVARIKEVLGSNFQQGVFDSIENVLGDHSFKREVAGEVERVAFDFETSVPTKARRSP